VATAPKLEAKLSFEKCLKLSAQQSALRVAIDRLIAESIEADRMRPESVPSILVNCLRDFVHAHFAADKQSPFRAALEELKKAERSLLLSVSVILQVC
jgi:hypothetical protein